MPPPIVKSTPDVISALPLRDTEAVVNVAWGALMKLQPEHVTPWLFDNTTLADEPNTSIGPVRCQGLELICSITIVFDVPVVSVRFGFAGTINDESIMLRNGISELFNIRPVEPTLKSETPVMDTPC